jgi:hypothetical protein
MVFSMKSDQDLPGIIPAAIVNKNDLMIWIQGRKNGDYSSD